MSSPPPVIFKRKSAGKKQQRAREGDSTEKGADVDGERDDSPSTLAVKLKKKIQKSKPKARLSFGGADEEEGDGEVFKIKKSNLSQRIGLGTHPGLIPPTLDQATISTPNDDDKPKYDAAYLKELKASTASRRPALPAGDSYDVDMSVDLDSGLGDAPMEVSVVDDDASASAAYIPSQSSIKVAKEKRERLRNTGAGEEDFISLSLTKRDDTPQGPHPESRLVREEDELGEGDDEYAEYTSAQERIALGKKSRKVEASKRRDAMKEMIADAEEEDEETAEWEMAQIRRGGSRSTQSSSTSKAKPKQVYRAAPIPLQTPLPSLTPALTRLSSTLTQLTSSHAKNVHALSSLAKEREEIEEREKELREMVVRAEEKRAWFKEFGEVVEGVAGFLDDKYPLLEKVEAEHISLLKERKEMIDKRRSDDDLDDLTTFFGPLPVRPSAAGKDQSEEEKLDEFGRAIPKPDPAQLKKERQLARVARRQLRSSKRKLVSASAKASKDEEEEGYSTDSSLLPSDASAYANALGELRDRTRGVLEDVRSVEFIDPSKPSTIALPVPLPVPVKHNDEAMEEGDKTQAQGQGKNKAKVKAVSAFRFAEWRHLYPDSYHNAWGGLGVVSIWEFWVRLEAVGWDCVRNRQWEQGEGGRSMEGWKWFQGVWGYCRPPVVGGTGTSTNASHHEGEEEEREPHPQEQDLLQSTISTSFVPLVCKLLEASLDPYSEKHVKRAVEVCEEVEVGLGLGDGGGGGVGGEMRGKFELLLKTISTSFRTSITATHAQLAQFLSPDSGVQPAGFDPDAFAARARYLNRRVKLLGNLLRWRRFVGRVGRVGGGGAGAGAGYAARGGPGAADQFGIGVMVERLVEKCIVEVAQGGWEVGGEGVVRHVATMLPDELVPFSLRKYR